MRHRVKEIDENETEEEQCHHFWVIEIANGPCSRGQCKYCGEVREFQNSITDFNNPRRKANLLNLPKMSKVKLDKGSKS
jgi:hypothetical protein